MAVALTSTVNLVFGSQVLDPVTGIILNDEMGDFSIPGAPNSFGLWPSPCRFPTHLTLLLPDTFVQLTTQNPENAHFHRQYLQSLNTPMVHSI